jgi:voltage-gated potassium channel
MAGRNTPKNKTTKKLASEPTERRSPSVREQVRRLYFGRSREAHRFRYALLSFDILIILFIVATSFIERTTWLEIVDVVIGLIILTEFSARLWVSERPLREFAHPATWADILAILSFLAPLAGEGLGFLRILRTLRLLHTYQLVARLRAESTFFRRNKETIVAIVNLGVFLFITTGVVYETQHWRNPNIANYVDALYFTVTALTTTGSFLKVRSGG